MVRFLNDLFGELDGSKTILNHLAVSVPGDTPHRILEECLVQVRALHASHDSFPTLADLRDFIILSLRPDIRTVLKSKSDPLARTAITEANQDSASQPTTEPPSQSHTFRLIQPVGGGGQARVYRICRNGEHRALKVTKGLEAQDIGRFNREARALMTIRHPGFIRAWSSGILETGDAFLEMELADGGTIKNFIHPDRLASPEYQQIGLLWFVKVAQALAAIHPKFDGDQRGLIHRDIKPANILLRRDGSVKVADLGLVLIDYQHSMTATGMLLGTAWYLSPESHSGSITPATDVYALGCSLYEFFTGQVPFRGETMMDCFRMHAKETAELDRIRDSELRLLISQMLAKQPSDRPNMRDIASRMYVILMQHPALTTDQKQHYFDFLDTQEYTLDAGLRQWFEQTLNLTRSVKAAPLSATRTINPTEEKAREKSGSKANEATQIFVRGGESALSESTSFELAATPEPATANDDELAVREIFAKLENAAPVGRSVLGRLTARIKSNARMISIATAATMLLLAVGSFGVYRWQSSQAIQQQLTLADNAVLSILNSPTKPTAQQIDAAVEQFNSSQTLVDSNQGDQRLKAITVANPNRAFTISSEGPQITSIRVTADLLLSELLDLSASESSKLDGTAHSLDRLEAAVMESKVKELLSLPFSPPIEDVVQQLQTAFPSEYMVGLSQDRLRIEQ